MTNIEIPVWQLVSIAGTVLGAFAGLVKLLLRQTERRLDLRFAMMNERFEVVARDSERIRELEIGIERLRGEIPLHYVRREDWVRNQRIIELKLDGLALKLENAQLTRTTP